MLRNGHAVADGRLERAQARLDLGAHGLDEPVEVRKVSHLGAQDEALVPSEAALLGRFELGPLGAQPSPGQIGEDGRVGLAAHDRDEHRLGRDAVDRGRHRGELAVCPLQHLGDPVQRIGALPDEGRSIAGQLAQLPLGAGTG